MTKQPEKTMTDLQEKAMRMALEVLEITWATEGGFFDNRDKIMSATQALRQALAEPEQECIYPECETGIGCDGPCGEKPVDTVKQEPVAWRWKERINNEFDSDWILTTYNPPPYAIQQEPLYAQPVDTVNTSQEPVDETAKCGHEPVVGTKTWVEDGKVFTQNLYASDIYITPPKREWIELTNEDIHNTEGYEEDRKMFRFAKSLLAKAKEQA